jgi:transcriptional regulator of acetoin/glycerol metabolism
MFARHDWPGNVRELRSVLERLAAFPDLGASALALGRESGDGPRLALASQALLALPYHEAKERVFDSFERTYLLEHLRATNGVVTRAAQRAGLPRQSFHRMLRRLGVTADDT